MKRQIASHLKDLPAVDHDAQRAWLQEAGVIQSYLEALDGIDDYRHRLARGKVDLDRLHRSASQELALRLSEYCEWTFPEPPSAIDWIRMASDATRLMRLHRVGENRLRGILAEIGEEAWLYGNVKSQSSIAEKIEAHRCKGVPLDLWDLVRYRVVTVDVRATRSVVEVLLNALRGDVVRCRNYYLRPRTGWEDTYRAIHLEIRIDHSDPAGFVEVQALTLARDAVGLIDHSVVHKRRQSHPRAHVKWLRDVSYAATIADAEKVCGAFAGYRSSQIVHATRA